MQQQLVYATLCMAMLLLSSAFQSRLRIVPGLVRRLATSLKDVPGVPPDCEYLKSVILLQGEVTAGYGRGSKKLGVPTANLPHFDDDLRRAQLARGVYFGWGRISGSDSILSCVANIGVSPTFAGQENPVNIVEAHFLDYDQGGDFYNKEIRLALVGFLRPEVKFKSLDELVAQINRDIETTRTACSPPLEGIALEARRLSEKFLQNKWDGGTKQQPSWGTMPLQK